MTAVYVGHKYLKKTVELVVSWSDSFAKTELKLLILLKSTVLSIRILKYNTLLFVWAEI